MAAAPPSGIRVLLADDDERFLQSLQELIQKQPELTVVGAAKDGLEAIELTDELAPDAVVIDLHMPLLDGVMLKTELIDGLVERLTAAHATA